MDINNSNTNYKDLITQLKQSNSNAKAVTNEPAERSQTARNLSKLADTDTVSVSYKAAKLQKISSEFFSGIIHSSQISALTERLYQDGFLTDTEFQNLGGQTQKVSAVSQASSFVNQLIMQEGDSGDKDSLKQLIQVADVLANINVKATPEIRQAEKQAYDFVSNLADRKQEEGADKSVVAGLKNVLDVLSVLDQIRKQEYSTGALASYGSVQEAYDEIHKET